MPLANAGGINYGALSVDRIMQGTHQVWPPFPVSMFAGTGAVALKRTGNDYRLLQDHGGGDWVAWQITQFAVLGGYTMRALSYCQLVAVQDSQAASTITRSGTWSGGYLTTQTDAYCEWTSTGQSLGWKPFFATNNGLNKVLIDGDATKANMLETAQQLVDRAAFPNTILVANGGTLNPTDRVLDCYHTSSSTARFVLLARGLANAAHTVRVICTGYKRAASSSNRLVYGDPASTPMYGSDSTNVTTAEHNDWANLWEFDSGVECAATVWPSIGTNQGFVGSQAHGYEEETSIAFTVDGATVTPTDGQVIAGTEVGVVKIDKLHHPNMAHIADLTATMSLTKAGLDLGMAVVFLTTGSFTTVYIGMMPYNGYRKDGSTGTFTTNQTRSGRFRQDAVFSLAANDASSHTATALQTATIWGTGTRAEQLPAAVGWWCRNPGSITSLFIQDRATNLDKLYPQLPGSGSVANGTTWTASVRYLAGFFADPNAILSA